MGWLSRLWASLWLDYATGYDMADSPLQRGDRTDAEMRELLRAGPVTVELDECATPSKEPAGSRARAIAWAEFRERHSSEPRRRR